MKAYLIGIRKGLEGNVPDPEGAVLLEHPQDARLSKRRYLLLSPVSGGMDIEYFDSLYKAANQYIRTGLRDIMEVDDSVWDAVIRFNEDRGKNGGHLIPTLLLLEPMGPLCPELYFHIFAGDPKRERISAGT